MIYKTSWTEEDVQNLIDNQVKENINLDYKASDSLAKMSEGCKKELSKDVSAFANSDGGILVYGVVEEGNIPVKIDNGCDPIKVTREWIEQVIDSRIQRKIDGIRIHQVALSGDNLGRVIYVISIPQSTDAPHMADDNRYYKRYNFKSAPMEDYEVRDVRRRHDHPNLKLDCKIISDPNKIRKNLEVQVYNTSSIPAKYYSVQLYFDKRVAISESDGFRREKDVDLFVNGENISYMCLAKNFAVPTSIPIWEGAVFTLTTVEFVESQHLKVATFGWKVSGPGFSNNNFFSYLF